MEPQSENSEPPINEEPQKVELKPMPKPAGFSHKSSLAKEKFASGGMSKKKKIIIGLIIAVVFLCFALTAVGVVVLNTIANSNASSCAPGTGRCVTPAPETPTPVPTPVVTPTPVGKTLTYKLDNDSSFTVAFNPEPTLETSKPEALFTYKDYEDNKVIATGVETVKSIYLAGKVSTGKVLGTNVADWDFVTVMSDVAGLGDSDTTFYSITRALRSPEGKYLPVKSDLESDFVIDGPYFFDLIVSLNTANKNIIGTNLPKEKNVWSKGSTWNLSLIQNLGVRITSENAPEYFLGESTDFYTQGYYIYNPQRPFTRKYLADNNLAGVDKINNEPVYTKDNNTYFALTDDGFLVELSKITNFGITKLNFGENIKQLKFDNSALENSSDYFIDNSAFGCGISEALTEADFPKKSELKKIGTTSNGKDLYAANGGVGEAYTKKIYDEDYIGNQLNQYNSFSGDDTTPYTFQEFMGYNPVFYLKNSQGFWERYTNYDFVVAGGCAKPAIYMYAPSGTNFNVKVIPNGELAFTLPEYNSRGWNVTTRADGTLLNAEDGKTYDYLWWDSVANPFATPKGTGWIGSKADAKAYLETSLNAMNLNAKERAQFLEYWLPKLEESSKANVQITFLFNEEVDRIAKLDVTGKLDNSFRVFMLYKPTDELTTLKSQTIKSANRSSNYLVEWGGGLGDL